jgi:hypothetical protein
MNLQNRMTILHQLQQYLLSDDPDWIEAKELAAYSNAWFLPSFIEIATTNIAKFLLQQETLEQVVNTYPQCIVPKKVGIVMAGNIPLVGFHDFLCTFLSGHRQVIKISSKDNILLPHLVQKMTTWDAGMQDLVQFEDMLKECDAYIATGSNNTARYFHQYFGRFPHIIRKNRTSIAVLEGTETASELDLLADDIQLYFGLGCRNVTQVIVPEGYDFLPLLQALDKYDYLMEAHKYKHNYDYVLTINIMNNTQYFTNGSIVLTPNPSPFSAISSLNYIYYSNQVDLIAAIDQEQLQVITGHQFKPFGEAQCPGFFDYADGEDTMAFLSVL